MNLRVAFAGASGTGKTTLARYVSETFNLPMNPVGSRGVAKAMGFESPYDVDKAGKRAEFQKRLLAEKYAWERERETFVTDRTVADNLTYQALHDVYSIDEADTDHTAIGLARYTHVFFCRVEDFFKVGDDAARVTARAYHEVFERCLQGLLTPGLARACHYNTVRGADLEDRKWFVKGVLSR